MTDQLDPLPITHRYAQLLLARAGQPNPSLGGALGNALAAGLAGFYESQDEKQKAAAERDLSLLGPTVPAPMPVPPAVQGGAPIASPAPVAPPTASLADALMARGQQLTPPQPISNLPPGVDNAAAPAPDQGTDKGPMLGAQRPPVSYIAKNFGEFAQPTAPPPQTAALPFAPDQSGPSQEALARALITQGGSGLNLNPTEQKVIAAANKYGIPPQELLAIKRNETTGSGAGQISSAGAIGPMQLMPATARDLGVDPRNEDQNIDGGARYYAQMRQQFGDPKLAAAAYNAGPGNVGRGIFPAETRGYMQKFAAQQPALTLAFNGQPQQGAPAPQSQQAPAPQQGQIGGFTPEVLKTLRDWAENGNAAQRDVATRYLQQYNQQRAGEEWKPIQITPPGAFSPITVLHNQARNEFRGLDGRPLNFAGGAGQVGDMSKTGQQYLDTLPSQGPITPSLVQSIAQGRAPYPNSRGKGGLELQAAVQQYEPGFSAQTYQQRQKAFNDFYGGGKSQESARRGRQAADHTLDLVDSFNGMNNLGYPLANRLKNEGADFLGIETGANAAKTNVNALANELSGIWKGGGISDASNNEWQSSVRINGSREQQQADVKKLITLYDAGIAEIEKKRQDAFGPEAKNLPPIVTPELQGAMDSIKRWATSGQFIDPRPKDQFGVPIPLAQLTSGPVTPPSNAVVPQGGAQSAPAPTATGPNGQKLILRNGQWTPLQ